MHISTLPCTLCLVRHGETDWNVSHRIQGQTDTPLNGNGLEQARMAARFLKAFAFHAAYSSDLERARATAERILNGRGLELQTDARLRERCYGLFQTLLYSEAEAQYPEVYARYRSRNPDCDLNGGESLRTLATRVQECLAQIATNHPGQQVLIVTHGGVLDVVYRLATGLPLEAPRDFLISNAAVSVVRGDGQVWQLERWNDTPDFDALDDDT
ncbi:MAG TPA: histidine phosphatase family protein [Gammaproteobacteria bacterium]|nr:histidine phosphatase family protein [Gammaproteobacteria bacterium]